MFLQSPTTTLRLLLGSIPFRLLVAPMDNPEAALAEDNPATHGLHADGFTVACSYDSVFLGDPIVEPAWEDFHRRHDAAFFHLDAYALASIDQSGLQDCSDSPGYAVRRHLREPTQNHVHPS